MTDVNLWMLVIDFALITLQESCGCAQLLGNLVRVCPPLRHAPQHPCGADAAVRPWNASLQICPWGSMWACSQKKIPSYHEK